MEFIGKLHALTNFLAVTDATDNQICRFITLDSCADIFPISTLLAKLEDDGEFTITGVFGFKSDTVEIFKNLSLVHESMITEAVKSNRVHLNGTLKELEIHQKIDITGKLNEDAGHMVILPIADFGVLVLFTSKEPDVDSSLELFLIAICALLEPEGYFEFVGQDQDGWPHWNQVKNLKRSYAIRGAACLKKTLLNVFFVKQKM